VPQGRASADAWKLGATIWRFEAEVFGENEKRENVERVCRFAFSLSLSHRLLKHATIAIKLHRRAEQAHSCALVERQPRCETHIGPPHGRLAGLRIPEPPRGREAEKPRNTCASGAEAACCTAGLH